MTSINPSPNKPRLLLVDDDPDLRRLLTLRLAAAGFNITAAASGEEALGIIVEIRPHLVLTDLQMTGMDGLQLFDEIYRENPSLPVIMLTAHGTIPNAIEATQRGLFAYLPKPIDHKKLLATIDKALHIGGSQEHPTTTHAGADWRSQIVSRSATMEALLEQARRIAASDVSVLIQSESGTGKELLAQAIHNASPRKDKPFVAVNCSAIPEQLMESELFGHAKGAFTGATSSRKGLFAEAEGGTIFLDEIGDMPVQFQSKLLRTLQENEVRPVGADAPFSIDVRVISATHKDLANEVEQGSFREDLFYRLNVVMLELAPLRERREDITLLVNYFLSRIAERNSETVRKFSPEAMELLVSAPWPGNIRQLQNVVEQTSVLSPVPLIPAAQVQKALRGEHDSLLSFTEARDRFERGYLIKLLQMTEGNVSKVARLAGKNRTELYKLFARHSLDPDLFRLADD